MDRIDAMKIFVTALDEGSLTGAGRKLGPSPAAVSRAVAFLEACVGAELLHRTTRSIKTSDAGEQYAVTCRRVLTDPEEAEKVAAGERSAPRGTLTLPPRRSLENPYYDRSSTRSWTRTRPCLRGSI